MISRTKVGMGTFITLSLEEKNKDSIEEGFSIMKDVELSLSSYDITAQIYKLNHNKKTYINRYTYEALSLSKKYYEQTEGYFDITVGSITEDLYRFGENQRVPHANELEDAHVNFKGLLFDIKEASLEEGIKVDLGGMGKGFGVDKVADYFKSKNVTKAVIAASGDIRCLDECHIDVQNPHAENYLVSFNTLKNETSVSTSGNYNRYVESTENNHLINPKLKKPAQNFSSITLISHIPSSDLDAYATAASVMPKEKTYIFLNSMPIAYIILESNGKLIISKNINEFVKNLKIY
ncbi:MAG: FAD:protein FMN transferase [Campylobacterales bacterium]|nr:FAD:protein FMN transferase [Campylobacterales bacterium]